MWADPNMSACAKVRRGASSQAGSCKGSHPASELGTLLFFASRALVGVPSVTKKEETEKKHCTELINMATE